MWDFLQNRQNTQQPAQPAAPAQNTNGQPPANSAGGLLGSLMGGSPQLANLGLGSIQGSSGGGIFGSLGGALTGAIPKPPMTGINPSGGSTSGSAGGSIMAQVPTGDLWNPTQPTSPSGSGSPQMVDDTPWWWKGPGSKSPNVPAMNNNFPGSMGGTPTATPGGGYGLPPGWQTAGKDVPMGQAIGDNPYGIPPNYIKVPGGGDSPGMGYGFAPPGTATTGGGFGGGMQFPAQNVNSDSLWQTLLQRMQQSGNQGPLYDGTNGGPSQGMIWK